MEDVRLEEDEAGIGVRSPPVDPVRTRELRMVGVVEELPGVLLAVPVPALSRGRRGSRRRRSRGVRPRSSRSDSGSPGCPRASLARWDRRPCRSSCGRASGRSATWSWPFAERPPVTGSYMTPRPPVCVPVEVEPGGVQVRADLGNRWLAAELVHVLRELEELEAPESRAPRGTRTPPGTRPAAATVGRGRSDPRGSSGRRDSPSSASARWHGCSRCCDA